MIVYTQGSYDIFHAGHVNFLRRSATYGNVFVGLLSDKSFRKYRGYPPINTFADRKRVLLSCEYVADVIETDNKKTKADILSVKPDIITIGTDWASKDIYKQWGVTHEMVDDKLIYLPYTPDISTTKIKRRVNEANQV